MFEAHATARGDPLPMCRALFRVAEPCALPARFPPLFAPSACAAPPPRAAAPQASAPRARARARRSVPLVTRAGCSPGSRPLLRSAAGSFTRDSVHKRVCESWGLHADDRAEIQESLLTAADAYE